MFVAKRRWDARIEYNIPACSSIHANSLIPTEAFTLLEDDESVCDIGSNGYVEDSSVCIGSNSFGKIINTWNHSSIVYIASFIIDFKLVVGREIKCLKQKHRITDDDYYILLQEMIRS